MKEIEVHAWCDGNHSSADGRIEAVIERTLTVNGSKPILLDLCADHDRLLTDLMEAGSVIPTSAQSSSNLPTLAKDTTECPECGLVSNSRSALGQHLNRMHRHGIKEYPRP